ncbi:CbiX/SirB N-terminal domain-containing protein [Actinoplanes sp. NPDC049596]|uniref:CbiX/SirB N-terminal domain-containing protein n=1 Tax=unclassified Actinoplanes TaxID=2626549 RepID=UPI0034407A7C
MRSARLTVLLVAHGSRDPRAAASTEALARAVGRARPGWSVRASYLDHAGPRPLDVLASLPAGSDVVVVPLLLTAAYHGRVDLPAVISAAAALPIRVSLADVLGPASRADLGLPARADLSPARADLSPARADLSPARADLSPARADLSPARADPSPARADLGPSAFGGFSRLSRADISGGLLDGLVRRLPTLDLDGVVLAAAGTRDAAARETITWVGEALSARLSLPCAVAYASGALPRPGDAVSGLRGKVGMSAYFLAPGFLYDLAVRSALDAGAVAIAEPLGDASDLVRVVTARVALTQSHYPVAA